MCTPILNQTTYEQVVKTVLSHLAEDLTLLFNESTGLHVHVGCGQGNSWTLDELKSIAKAVFLFEDAIDLMHAAHRTEENWMISSNRWNPAMQGSTTEGVIEVIEASLTEADFLNVVGNRKWFKYNFMTNAMYGTIEFRQSEAHGDPQKAVEWIKFISLFVSAALGAAKWEWKLWAGALGKEAIHTNPKPKRQLAYLSLPDAVWRRFGIPSHLRQLIPELYEEHQDRLHKAKMFQVFQEAAASAQSFIRKSTGG